MNKEQVSVQSDRQKTLRLSIIWLAITSILLAFFHYVPQIDLWVADQFHVNDRWVWRTSFWEFIREAYRFGTFFLALGFLILALYSLKKTTFVDKRIYQFGAVFSIVGPGLIVNGMLKAFWGRARPSAVEEFGGERIFTPASIVPVDQCSENCSFVSGEGSGAAVMMFTFLMMFGTTPLRRAAIIAFSVPMGFLRVAFGKHFTSDVILSFTLMWALGYFLMWFYGLSRRDMVTHWSQIRADLGAITSAVSHPIQGRRAP